MDEVVSPLERDHSLSVVLPGGLEKNATVHGSKPVMDLLVTLCASYHLNPSDYTVEVLSPNKNHISFKPNSPIGSLEAEKIVLKPRGAEEKPKRPYMPEATVRLLINYNKAHKAVVRVSPTVPLELLLPLVCAKCEFQVGTTVLRRDSGCTEPLDMTRSLNEHGLREVFAEDSADQQHRARTPEAEQPAKEARQKENAGFLSLFRRKKKTSELDAAASAPASPATNKLTVVSTTAQDTPKKRRAPQPPLGGSLSVPNNLSTCHLRAPQSSSDSTLRRTKRKAPPPPCTDSSQEQQEDTQATGPVLPPHPLEELRESDDSTSSNPSLCSSPAPPSSSPAPPSSSSSRPSFERRLPSFGGKDFSDARSSLAKVLTLSVSKGTLVKHLRNSASLPKLQGRSSFLTQRFPDHGAFCMELESVLKSRLPTESEWEDPLRRKGMNTFKVVPLNKQESQEPETPHDRQSKAPPEDCDSPDSPPPLQEESDASDYPDQEESDGPDSPPPDQEACDAPESPPPPQEESDTSDSPPPDQECDAPESPPPEESDTSDSPPPPQEESDGPDSPPPDQEACDAPESPPPPQEESDTSESPPPPQEESDGPDSPPPDQECDGPNSPPPPQEESDTSDSPPPDQEACEAPDSPPPPQVVPGAVDTPPPDQEVSAAPGSPPPVLEESDTPGCPDQEVCDAPDFPPPPQEESDGPGSPPPAPDSDNHDFTFLPLSEVEGGDEGVMEEEEEEPEAAEPEKPPSADQINESPAQRSVSADRDQWGSCEDVFPPPPPPVFFDEDLEDVQEDTTVDSPDTTAAPEPSDKTRAAPSRFAQAVALAVLRSRQQRHRASASRSTCQ